MFDQATVEMLMEGVVDTLYMTIVSTFFSYVFGIVMAVVLVICRKDGIRPNPVVYSVLDVVHAFEKACGKPIPYEIKERRPGDIATCYADPSKAKAELGWEAQYGIEEMCEDSWRWQSMNPNGYEE